MRPARRRAKKAPPSPPFVPAQLTPRRDALRRSLVDKLLTKYHPGNPESSTEKFIRKGVEKLIELPKIKEGDLERLEYQIRMHSNSEVQDILLQPHKNIAARKQGLVDEWCVMHTWNSKAMKSDHENKVVKAQQARKSYKEGLDKQMMEMEKKQAFKITDKAEDAAMIASKIKQFSNDMAAKRDKVAAAKLEERTMRHAEMQEFKDRAAQLKLEQKEEELEDLAALRKDMEDQFQENLKKKAKIAAQLTSWKEENEQNLKVKAAQQEKERRQEVEYAKRAMRALEEKELARIRDLQALKEKMMGKEAMSLEQGKKMEEQAKEDELKAAMEQSKALRKAEEQYHQQQAAKAAKKKEMQRELSKQLAEFNQRKVVLKRAEDEQAAIFKRQVQEAFAQERERQAKNKAKQLKHRIELENQIRGRVRLRGRDELLMSESEKKFNKKLLES